LAPLGVLLAFPISTEMVNSQLQAELTDAIGEAGLRIEIAARPDAHR
jgi:hypothetical protein